MAYDVYIPKYHLRLVLHMPGLTQITLNHPDIAVLRFTTAPGCDPCGIEFLVSEVERNRVDVLAAITLPDAE